jgi:hypothetical protein
MGPVTSGASAERDDAQRQILAGAPDYEEVIQLAKAERAAVLLALLASFAAWMKSLIRRHPPAVDSYNGVRAHSDT